MTKPSLIYIEQVSDILRRRDAFASLCSVPNILSKFPWRNAEAENVRERYLLRSEAEELIRAWLSVPYRTNRGRALLEESHRNRIFAHNRRNHVRRAKSALREWEDELELQLKADEIESAALRGEIAFAEDLLKRFPYNRIPYLRNRTHRTIAAMRARVASIQPPVIEVVSLETPAESPVNESESPPEPPPPPPLKWRQNHPFYEVYPHQGFQRIVAVDKPRDKRLKFFGQKEEFIPDLISLGPVNVSKDRLYGRGSRFQAKLTSGEVEALGLRQ